MSVYDTLFATSSELRFNPHVHAVFLDGVSQDKPEDDDELAFRGLAHLTTRDVAAVLEQSEPPPAGARGAGDGGARAPSAARGPARDRRRGRRAQHAASAAS